MLWTMANNRHCTSTFNLVRKVKRLMRFCTQMLAKTGSTTPALRAAQCPQPSGVDLLALFGIDLGFHRIDQVQRLRIHRHGKIPARCGGFAQAACLQRAGDAVFRAGMVNIIGAIAVDLVAGMAGQFFSLRTSIHLFVWIEREVRNQ